MKIPVAGLPNAGPGPATFKVFVTAISFAHKVFPTDTPPGVYTDAVALDVEVASVDEEQMILFPLIPESAILGPLIAPPT